MCKYKYGTHNEQSVIETRQSKTTAPEDSYLFTWKKNAASGGIQTCDILRTRQILYQLSYWGSTGGQAKSWNVMQMQGHLFLVKQDYSKLCTKEWAGVI